MLSCVSVAEELLRAGAEPNLCDTSAALQWTAGTNQNVTTNSAATQWHVTTNQNETQHSSGATQCFRPLPAIQALDNTSGATCLTRGWTVMHDAARAGYKDMLQCLLHYGGDITIRDSLGNTPAHTAAIHGHTRIVRYLAKAMDIKRSYNNDGKTPLDIKSCNNNVPHHHRKWIHRSRSKYYYSHIREQSLFTAGGGRCKFENRMHSKFAPPPRNSHVTFLPPLGSSALKLCPPHWFRLCTR